MTLVQSIFYNNPDLYPPIINSTRLLALAGFEVSVVCRDDGQAWNVKYPETTHIARINSRGTGGSWREYLGFVTTCLRHDCAQAAVIFGHDMHGLLPARLLAWRYRRPLIYHCHDFAESNRRLSAGSHVVRLFERRFARTSALVIVPDADRSEIVRAELHLTSQPVIVANAPLRQPLLISNRLQQTLLTRGRCYEHIVFRQGRIAVGHGIEATIRSLPLWNRSIWGFVIMGYGEPAYLESLIKLADSLEVSGQFVILPPVGYDQVAEFTVGASIGHALYDPIHINNVHITTASNKIMEYTAAAVPLVVSDRPSLRQFVEEHQCGLAADERSPESIAAMINALLSDPERLRRWGENARRFFEAKYCYNRQFAPVFDWLQTQAVNESLN